MLFLLWLHLFFLSGVISPLISSRCWAPTDLGSSSFSVLFFHLFILFVKFSRQDDWSGLPFPSPVDHILSELFTMICTPAGDTKAQFWLSLWGLGPGAHKVCLNPSSLWQVKGLLLNLILSLLLSYSKIYYYLYPWGTGLCPQAALLFFDSSSLEIIIHYCSRASIGARQITKLDLGQNCFSYVKIAIPGSLFVVNPCLICLHYFQMLISSPWSYATDGHDFDNLSTIWSQQTQGLLGFPLLKSYYKVFYHIPYDCVKSLT